MGRPDRDDGTADVAPVATRRRVVGSVRLAWGATLLAAPGTVAGAMGAADEPASRRLARLLGTRHLLQAAVELAWWPRFRRLGAAVDGAHALTAVAAALDRRWRRPALTDAALAFALAAAAGLPPGTGRSRSGP